MLMTPKNARPSMSNGDKVGRVAAITVSVADQLVDIVKFEYQDGSSRRFGDCVGGLEQPMWVLPHDSHLVKIHIKTGASLNGCCFETSTGEISPWYGQHGGHPTSFSVASGCHIVGVEMRAGEMTKIPTGIKEQRIGQPPARSPVKTRGLDARVVQATPKVSEEALLLHKALGQMSARLAASKDGVAASKLQQQAAYQGYMVHIQRTDVQHLSSMTEAMQTKVSQVVGSYTEDITLENITNKSDRPRSFTRKGDGMMIRWEPGGWWMGETAARSQGWWIGETAAKSPGIAFACTNDKDSVAATEWKVRGDWGFTWHIVPLSATMELIQPKPKAPEPVPPKVSSLTVKAQALHGAAKDAASGVHAWWNEGGQEAVQSAYSSCIQGLLRCLEPLSASDPQGSLRQSVRPVLEKANADGRLDAVLEQVQADRAKRAKFKTRDLGEEDLETPEVPQNDTRGLLEAPNSVLASAITPYSKIDSTPSFIRKLAEDTKVPMLEAQVREANAKIQHMELLESQRVDEEAQRTFEFAQAHDRQTASMKQMYETLLREAQAAIQGSTAGADQTIMNENAYLMDMVAEKTRSEVQLKNELLSMQEQMQGLIRDKADSWQVLKLVNVRSSPSSDAEVLKVKYESSIVRGIEENGWVALTDEPGFMVIDVEGYGSVLQRHQDHDRPPAEFDGLHKHYTDQLNDAQLQIDEFSHRCSQLEAELETRDSLLKTDEVSVAHKLDEAVASLEVLAQRNGELETALAETDGQRARLELQLHQASGVGNAAEVLGQRNADLETAVGDYAQRLSESEQRNARFEALLQQQNAELEAARELEILQQQQQTSPRHVRLEGDLEQRNRIISDLEQRNVQLEADLEALHQQRAAGAEQAEMSNDQAQRNAELETMLQDYESRLEEVTRFAEAQSKSNEENFELSRKYEVTAHQLQTQLADREQEIAGLQKEVSNGQTRDGRRSDGGVQNTLLPSSTATSTTTPPRLISPSISSSLMASTKASTAKQMKDVKPVLYSRTSSATAAQPRSVTMPATAAQPRSVNAPRVTTISTPQVGQPVVHRSTMSPSISSARPGRLQPTLESSRLR